MLRRSVSGEWWHSTQSSLLLPVPILGEVKLSVTSDRPRHHRCMNSNINTETFTRRSAIKVFKQRSTVAQCLVILKSHYYTSAIMSTWNLQLQKLNLKTPVPS